MWTESANPTYTRRQLLESSTLGTLALAGMLRSDQPVMGSERGEGESALSLRRPHFPPKVKRVIHLLMNGGPSQMDTFDRKPELNRLDGKPLPESIRTQLQRVQLNRVGNIFGSPFKFKRYGSVV